MAKLRRVLSAVLPVVCPPYAYAASPGLLSRARLGLAASLEASAAEPAAPSSGDCLHSRRGISIDSVHVFRSQVCADETPPNVPSVAARFLSAYCSKNPVHQLSINAELRVSLNSKIGQRSSICSAAPRRKEGPASSSESSSSENFGKQEKEINERSADPEASKTDGGQEAKEGSARYKSSSEDTPKDDHRVVEIVQMRRSRGGIGGYLFHLWSSMKMAAYLQFHTIVLEEKFDVNDFLEGARHAFTVVQELFGKGEFAALSSMVSPRVLDAFKGTYGEFMAKKKDAGWRVEYTVSKADSARLVDFEFAFEEDGRGGYGLQSVVPQIDSYHDDMFLVLAVQLYAEVSMRTYNQHGALALHSVNKGLHVIKLARQIPKISGWAKPVRELESPWYFVDLR